jgi:peptidyl-prolyl cis-trans isomerase A (cyclophilin A)
MYRKFRNFILMSIFALMSLPAQTQENTIDVTIITTLGSIDIALYPDRAPITVDNFLKYADAGLYNDGAFTRTVRYDNDNGTPKIEVIQGGPRLDVARFPAIPLETTQQTGILHENGVISMARGAPTSADSEFFITIGAQPSLDFGGTRNKDGQGFAAFGIVTNGMPVVRAINAIRETKDTEDAYTKGQYLANPVKIIQVMRK